MTVAPKVMGGTGGAVGGLGIQPPEEVGEWCGGRHFPNGCPPGWGKEIPVDLKAFSRPLEDTLYWQSIPLPGGWHIGLISVVALACLIIIVVSAMTRTVVLHRSRPG